MASTSDVYGMSPDIPFREDGNLGLGDSTVPRWSYPASKVFDEHLALAYMEAYDFPVVLLRFFGSYGPNQNLMVGRTTVCLHQRRNE
ncbi:MAG: GDP-mannose 4,6-dehydratase [Bacteroidia bacterium]